MKKWVVLILASAALFVQPALSQQKSTIVVRAFTLASGVSWPYDMKQMQAQTVAEMQSKLVNKFKVTAEMPGGENRVYTLDGEVKEWHPGNRAKRALVGMGSGRETAKIRYWLSDQTGKKVLEKEDTIRAEFWNNVYAGSVGELAHPFADKIAGRISDAKLE